MKKWRIFEENCVKYLNSKFSNYADFILEGDSNSRKSDILVSTKNGKNFYIEAKDSPSQSGQFVLLPDLNKDVFVYSKLNNTEINEYSEKIIDYMNHDFDSFKNPGTSGKTITFEDNYKIFSEWIIKMYKEKNVSLVITKDFTILPIEKFMDYFDITAKYRVKKSGSGYVAKKNIENIMKFIEKSEYTIINTEIIDKKIFVYSPNNLDKKRFFVNGKEYMFSKKNNNKYEIRKLSNTKNSNVIFSIEKKENVLGLSEEEIIKYLI